MSSTPQPALEGWFVDGDDPALLGGRCTTCGTFTFPRREGFCPNPTCDGRELDEVPLSRRGTVWSYATNHYPPPAPAVVTAPYTVVAVTLATEQMTVLGLLHGAAPLDEVKVGSEVELCLETLAIDAEDRSQDRSVWAWRPVAGGAA